MKKTIMLSLFFLFCVTLTQAQPAKYDAVEASKVKEAIRKIIQELSDAYVTQDQKVFERYLSPSFFMISPEDRVSTKALVLQVVEKGSEFPKGMKVKSKIEDLEVTYEGNSAAAIYHETFETEMNGTLFDTKSLQRVSAFFVRQGNNWQLLTEHRTYRPMIRTTKRIDPKMLDAVVGEYQAEEGKTTIVTLADGKLFSQKTGSPKFELLPENDATFYAKLGNLEMIFAFTKDSGGKVTHMVIVNPAPASSVLIRPKIK